MTRVPFGHPEAAVNRPLRSRRAHRGAPPPLRRTCRVRPPSEGATALPVLEDLVGLFVLAAVLLASAPEPPLPAVLTLPDALRLFRERSLDLLLADAQVAAARGDQAAAGAVPNPALSGSIGRSFDCSGCSALALGLGLSDQAALSEMLSGKRGLRVDAARAALEAAHLSRDDAERTLRLALQQAMVDAALQRAQVAFLLAVREPLPDFRVDPELLEQAARLTLAPGDAGVLLDAATQARPDLRALERQEARARAALDLARRQRIPEVTLSAQYAQEGTGGSAVTPPTVTFGASLPVPLFYQQQGEVQRAEADLRTQTVQRDKAAAQLASEVITAYGAFAASRKLVDRMRGGLLERAQRARDLTRIQYEKGAARLLELLDAQRAFAQVRAEYLQDLHDLWVNLFKLEAAVGRELRS